MTDNQRNWLLNKYNYIFNKYIVLVPFSQDTWNDFVGELNDLEKKCKKSKEAQDYTVKVSISLVDFFDKLHLTGGEK